MTDKDTARAPHAVRSASIGRPLRVRRRPDLEVVRWPTVRNHAWVIKDPVASSFLQLGEEEVAVLELLDGQISLDELRRRLESRFFPLQFPTPQLYQFLGQLHEHGLLVTDAAGQAGPLWERRQRRRERDWTSRLLNCLAIRLPGWNPSRLLDAVYPRLRWLFRGPLLGLALLTSSAAGLWLLLHAGEVLERLPPPEELVRPQNVLSLLVAWGLAKLWHESAHALACQHFGGRCREMGVMLLMFTPCFYCDISDAWAFRSKWRRMAVSAAGLGAELVLAAGAAWLWWFSAPGWLNSLALHLMILCSLNTLVLNGNPLLRFDGYYLLADLLDIPDLDRQAGLLVRSDFARWLFGVRLYHPRLLPQRRRGGLRLYWIAATGYRAFLLATVLIVIDRFAAGRGYPLTGRLLMVWIGLLVTVAVLWRVAQFVRGVLRIARARWPTVAARTILLGLLVLGLVWLPYPDSLTVPAILSPDAAENVFVSIPGRLQLAVPAGALVEQGQLLGRLENLELQRQVAALRGQRDRQHTQVLNLDRRRTRDPWTATELATAQAVLEDLGQRWRDRQLDLARLELLAPQAGIVLAPPARPELGDSGDELGGWSGTPLETRNLGAPLEIGTLFCCVADPGRLQAILQLTAADLERVAIGQRVTLRLGRWPATTVDGRLTDIARADQNELRLEGTTSDQRSSWPDTRRGGASAPAYRARVTISGESSGLLSGCVVDAVVHGPPRSLAQQMARFVRVTFLSRP